MKMSIWSRSARAAETRLRTSETQVRVFWAEKYSFVETPIMRRGGCEEEEDSVMVTEGYRVEEALVYGSDDTSLSMYEILLHSICLVWKGYVKDTV